MTYVFQNDLSLVTKSVPKRFLSTDLYFLWRR